MSARIVFDDDMVVGLVEGHVAEYLHLPHFS